VTSESLPLAMALLSAEGMKLLPPDASFCTGKLFPVTIGEVKAAIVIPATAVRSHSGSIVEVIAAVNLKEALRLSDGDTVTLVL
jgi:CTP-dependent riboflavin kinase